MNRQMDLVTEIVKKGLFQKVALVLLLMCVPTRALPFSNRSSLESLKERFQNPPVNSGTVTLWWLNGTLTKAGIREQMLAIRDRCGFSGVAPLTRYRSKPSTNPEYLSEDYFEMYGHILDTAKELGMTVVFYDDCDFPSGTAGNRMKDVYPKDLAKYLHRSEITLQGPSEAEIPVPEGKLMSVVATNLDTKESSVITERVQVDSRTSTIRWKAPEGNWRAQAFVCTTDPTSRFVNYLDPQAVEKFIGLTCDRFAKRFPEHFGTTVKMTFFDDLGYFVVKNYQMWTNDYNEKFMEEYGASPELWYPALWEDIGPETESARARLFSLRDRLFAQGYPKTIQEWCDARDMSCSGHPAASYRPNPIQCPGDAILFYKYQEVPLTDYIHFHHHGVHGFKIPASAAYNFDKPVLVCEIYGNFHQKLPNDGEMLYRAGMEVYARGINYLLPHGTWWDEKNVSTIPEISWRNPAMADALPAYNTWAGRCETLLRAGRHVADVGVVYPISDLQARYNFKDYKDSLNGRIVPRGSDYYELLELLTCDIRRDYTLIHPEVIDEKCTVQGNEFVLNNKVNWERYRVLILPSCRTISLSNLKKIKRFHDNGGVVIATNCLPEKSVEPGHDKDIQNIADQMFSGNGKAIFVSKLGTASLQAALDKIDITWDVVIENVREVAQSSRPGPKDPEADKMAFAFNYIHKVKSGADIYFFSNSTGRAAVADMAIASDKTPTLWNPHTGQIEAISHKRIGKTVSINLRLDPIQSRFIVFEN